MPKQNLIYYLTWKAYTVMPGEEVKHETKLKINMNVLTQEKIYP